jgi:decaprenylphospho-beta-D-erythro-pentofuranosid-2-ulose 2-reductase
MNNKKPYLLVIGAGSDIAKETYNNFAKNGFNLYLALRNPEEITSYVNDLRIRYDIEVDVIKWSLGENIDFQKLNPFPEVTLFTVGLLDNTNKLSPEEITNINYTKSIKLLDNISNHCSTLLSGSLLVISSVAGERGKERNLYYNAAKSAMTSYLSGLRQKYYKNNVHIMTIIPGIVATKMTADLKLSRILTSSPRKVGQDIFNAYQKRKDILYTPWYWRYIMLIISNIPEFIYKRIKL